MSTLSLLQIGRALAGKKKLAQTRVFLSCGKNSTFFFLSFFFFFSPVFSQTLKTSHHWPGQLQSPLAHTIVWIKLFFTEIDFGLCEWCQYKFTNFHEINFHRQKKKKRKTQTTIQQLDVTEFASGRAIWNYPHTSPSPICS